MYATYPSAVVFAKLNPNVLVDNISFPIATCFAGLTPSNPPWKASVNLLAFNAVLPETLINGSAPVVAIPSVLFSNKKFELLPVTALSESGAK